MFGGARIPEHGQEAWAAKNETQRKTCMLCHIITMRQGNLHVYALYSATTQYREFVVVTGVGQGSWKQEIVALVMLEPQRLA